MAKIKSSTSQPEAIKIFTDREDPQEAFERKFRVFYEDWRNDYYVLSYYGIGGIGKTSFINKLSRVIRGLEGNEPRILDKIDCDYIRYDFDAKTSGTDKESILYSLRNQLLEKNKDFSFFKFDYALFLCTRNTNKYTSNDESAKSLLERTPWLDMIFSTLELVPGVGMLTSVFQKVDKCSNLIKGAIGKQLDNIQFQKFLKDIECLEPPEILEKLHSYFIEDMKENMQKIATRPVVIFIDTYEKYIDTLNSDICVVTEDYWLRKGANSVIRSIPGILWVITGREKLYWSDDDEWDEILSDCPLSQMSEEEKDTLARSELEQHLLGDLSIKDATDFLRKSGIANTTLCTQLYELTHGTPLFLDICVKTHKELCAKDIIPNIDMFGKDINELISKYLHNMNESNQEMTYCLACLGAWDDETVKMVCEKATSLRHYRFSKYKEFINHSFIIKNTDGTYYMHKTVRNAALKKAYEEIIEEIRSIHLAVIKEKVETTIGTESNVVLSEYFRLLTENDYTYDKIYENIPLIINKSYNLIDTGNYELPYVLIKKLFVIVSTMHKNTDLDTIVRSIYGRTLTLKGYAKEALDIVANITITTELCNTTKPEYFMILQNIAFIYEDNGMYQKCYSLLSDLLCKCQQLLGNEHHFTVSVMNNLANSYINIGEPQKALELRKETLEIANKTLDNNDPNTLKMISNLANSYSEMGEYQTALELSENVLKTESQTLGKNHPNTLKSMNNLAIIYDSIGNYKKALKIKQELLESSTNILGAEHPFTLTVKNNLASSYDDTGEYQKAFELRKSVLNSRLHTLGNHHPDTISSMNDLAISYDNNGDYQEAFELKKETLSLCTEILGPTHPNTLRTMSNLALSYSINKDFQNSFKLRKDVLDTKMQIFGKEHPDTLHAMIELSISYDDMEEFQNALKLRKNILEICKLKLGKTHPYTLDTIYRLSSSYRNIGDFKKAFSLAENLSNIYSTIYGDTHPEVLKSKRLLADLCNNLGKYQYAIELGTDIVELSRHLYGENHLITIDLMYNLEVFYINAGNNLKALEIHEELLRINSRMLGDDHPDVLEDMLCLAFSYEDIGEHQKCISLKQKFLESKIRIFGNEHTDTFDAILSLAVSYHNLGEYQNVLNLFEQLLSISKNSNGSIGSLSTTDIEDSIINLRDLLQNQ